MTKADDAVTLFQQGFNCTQSILSVFAPDFGLDRDMARRISQGFGAGIARTDKMCGSLSAAIMVIGLRYGGIRADDVAAKEKSYAVVGEFLNKFREHHGSVACTDLLGYDLSDPRQFADAKTHKVAMERCPVFIRDAVKLVETLIQTNDVAISGGDSIRKKLEKIRSAQKPVDNEKLMEKQHPRQITGSETPNNNAIDPSFKKKLD